MDCLVSWRTRGLTAIYARFRRASWSSMPPPVGLPDPVSHNLAGTQMDRYRNFAPCVPKPSAMDEIIRDRIEAWNSRLAVASGGHGGRSRHAAERVLLAIIEDVPPPSPYPTARRPSGVGCCATVPSAMPAR
jgi:hypothetical protein